MEGGTLSSSCRTSDSDGSTYVRNIGPPESAISASACSAHTYTVRHVTRQYGSHAKDEKVAYMYIDKNTKIKKQLHVRSY